MTGVAALFGSTGLVGTDVLRLLVADPEISRVHVFSRRDAPAPNPKILPHRSDLASAEEITAAMREFPPEFALCCLGTTMARAKTRAEFRRVDHDLVLNAAKACRALGAKTFGVLSSVGARANAGAFYLRVKAETERDLATLGFSSLVVLRPSVLLGERAGDSAALKAVTRLSGVIAPALRGPFARYRPVDPRLVAERLITETRAAPSGLRVIENEAILAETSRQ